MSQRILDDDLEDGDDGTVQGWSKDEPKEGILGSCRRDGNKKSFVFTGVIVVAVVLVLAIVGLYATRKEVVESKANDIENPLSKIAVSPIPEGAVTETFLLGATDDFSEPLEVPVQSMWMRNVRSPRPEGDIAIHQIHLSAVDENYNLIPQHILYNHHSLILVDGDIFAAFGAEGAQSYVSYPANYAAILRKDQKVNVTTMYLPLMGFAANTPTRVFVNFTLVYTKLDSGNNGEISNEEEKKWKSLDMELLGIVHKNNPDFDIPGGGGKDSAYCESVTSQWWNPNATLILAMGHLHIGGINLTLIDATNDNTTILVVAPLFDSNGFVVRLGGSYLDYSLVRRNSYTTIACYHNDRPFKNVMGLWELYYHETDNDDNASHRKKQKTRFFAF